MERLKRTVIVGRWLFRHRSHMPVLFATLFIPALSYYKLPPDSYFVQLHWELFCMGISFIGLALRIMTVAYISEASSSRELSNPKATQLNTTGIYSLLRHPLYLGNAIIWLGVASTMRLWWLSLSFLVISLIHYRLIICAEEAYLRDLFGTVHSEWAQKTPLLIPAFHHWVPPQFPFSMAMVLRREYSGFFQIVAVFSFMNALLNYTARGIWSVDTVFQNLLIASSLICGGVWFAVKKTPWLPAPDRELQTRRKESEEGPTRVRTKGA